VTSYGRDVIGEESGKTAEVTSLGSMSRDRQVAERMYAYY